MVMVVVVRPSEMERGGYISPPPSPSDDEPSSLTDETWEPVRLSLCTHTKMTTTLLDRESPSFFLTGGPPQRETWGGGHGERRRWDSRMYRRRCAGQGGGMVRSVTLPLASYVNAQEAAWVGEKTRSDDPATGGK